MMTGSPGAGFYPFGEALAKAYALALPDFRVEVHESAGAVTNLQAIERGDADIGFAFADVAYIAYVGRMAGRPPFEHLRGIVDLPLTPLHLVARAGSSIRRIEDLRHQRVGVGPAGSGTTLTATIVLGAFGIDPGSVQTQSLSFNEQAEQLMAGRLDALFVNASYPAASVRAATKAGARLVPVDGAGVDRLRLEYPFFRSTFIPGDTYFGQHQLVNTIGVDSLLVCRSDLAESTVYRLTKAFFEVLPTLAFEKEWLRQVDIEQAPATPIPLHVGAARYYRERELSR